MNISFKRLIVHTAVYLSSFLLCSSGVLHAAIINPVINFENLATGSAPEVGQNGLIVRSNLFAAGNTTEIRDNSVDPSPSNPFDDWSKSLYVNTNTELADTMVVYRWELFDEGPDKGNVMLTYYIASREGSNSQEGFYLTIGGGTGTGQNNDGVFLRVYGGAGIYANTPGNGSLNTGANPGFDTVTTLGIEWDFSVNSGAYLLTVNGNYITDGMGDPRYFAMLNPDAELKSISMRGRPGRNSQYFIGEITAIPEPGVMAFGMALILFGVLGRKRWVVGKKESSVCQNG